jgi:hypothetical protein
MTPSDATRLQSLLDASLRDTIPAGETTELHGAWAALMWRMESGFDLPPAWMDTQPMDGYDEA